MKVVLAIALATSLGCIAPSGGFAATPAPAATHAPHPRATFGIAVRGRNYPRYRVSTWTSLRGSGRGVAAATPVPVATPVAAATPVPAGTRHDKFTP